MKHDFNILSGLKMMDNDNESCEWLNTILSRYWSHYEAGLSETIQFSVNAVLESNKPAFLVRYSIY